MREGFRKRAGIIEIKAGAAKTASRGVIPILPNLAAWLKPHWKQAGPVCYFTNMVDQFRDMTRAVNQARRAAWAKSKGVSDETLKQADERAAARRKDENKKKNGRRARHESVAAWTKRKSEGNNFRMDRHCPGRVIIWCQVRAMFCREIFPARKGLSSQVGFGQAKIRRRMIELMTIGYEGMTLKEFLALLERCRVTMLVDVRELAISRKPGFGKVALAEALEKRGIKYEHLVELGCPKVIRHRYRADGDWARYTRKYKAYLESQEAPVEQLWNLMQDERCCLMCFETDFNFCHRSFIAERMVAVAEDVPIKAHHLTGPMTGRVVRRELVPA